MAEAPTTVYPASPIKRHRSSKAEVEARREALFQIVRSQRPMTVRQVFYRATVLNLVDKTEGDYSKVQTDLVYMRRTGMLPYNWLVDSTRAQRRPRTFNSVEEAINDTAHFYRKALWSDLDVYVEIWLEKDALAGVIYPITEKYDVPLMVARGFASLSFLYAAAEHIEYTAKRAYIYHLGDYDPSGVNAAEKIEQTLREMAPNAEIHFQRLAVTTHQIDAWSLPTRPTKKTDSRSKNFGDISVELDAIEPDRLRLLVENVIQRHLPSEQFNILKIAEESEKSLLSSLARIFSQSLNEEGRE